MASVGNKEVVMRPEAKKILFTRRIQIMHLCMKTAVKNISFHSFSANFPSLESPLLTLQNLCLKTKKKQDFFLRYLASCAWDTHELKSSSFTTLANDKRRLEHISPGKLLEAAMSTYFPFSPLNDVLITRRRILQLKLANLSFRKSAFSDLQFLFSHRYK